MPTDTARRTRPGKRDRLVAAATDLVYRQGVSRTTLADIAGSADVPLGNVYYYFRTKDEIVHAVVDVHRERLEATFAELESRHRTPRARLRAFVRMLGERAASIPHRYGCPHGTLCAELAKQDSGPDPSAGTLLQLQLDWAERQFRALGRRDAADLAVELVAAYQGSAVLTSALDRPELMLRRVRRLVRWIDSLATTERGVRQ